MPGVADAERRTKLTQEHQRRRSEMAEILTMVADGRLHEADERQLEVIRLALELNTLMSGKQETSVSLDTQALSTALKEAVKEALQQLPVGTSVGGGGSGVVAGDRPQMKHVSLTTFAQKDEGLDIAHGDTLGETKEGEDEAKEKLAKLKKLKGGK